MIGSKKGSLAGIFSEDFFLYLIGRGHYLFSLEGYSKIINQVIENSSFLILGGAGSIGSAVVKEIFKRNPKVLHVVDISENNLAELVRDIRSSLGYIEGDFRTFVLDVGSDIYDKFIEDFGKYDYVLNFFALKHVRSERDPYTLMSMIRVNILNTIKTINHSIQKGSKKYFCVSTDKSTNPVNLMGASKRIMELFLLKYSTAIESSTARFANVIFSDGSLTYGFIKRLLKKQPITIPSVIKRYFITPYEASVLCLLSALLGNNLEIFFPKLDPYKDMQSFWDIAKRFLEFLGYEPYICSTEEEARELVKELPEKGFWPCYISYTDTTGEKEYEEFYTEKDLIDWDRFKNIGIIKMNYDLSLLEKLDYFVEKINHMLKTLTWNKQQIVDLFKEVLTDFEHKETGKYLDEKM